MNSLKATLFICLILVVAGCARTFESNAWKATPEADRHVFAESIIERKTLLGRTREQVANQLGHPSTWEVHSNRYYYLVKMDGSGFNQVTALVVEFGQDGRATNVFLSED